MLILKDLTSISAKGYRGLLYLIFNFDIEIAILWYNAAQILKGLYYCKWLFVYCKNRHSGWRAELPLTYHFSFSSIDWQTYSAVCLHSSNKDSLQVFWCMCQKHKVITYCNSRTFIAETLVEAWILKRFPSNLKSTVIPLLLSSLSCRSFVTHGGRC